MKGLTWNKAAIAGVAPALTTILSALDAHQGWGLGEEFWGAGDDCGSRPPDVRYPEPRGAPSAPNVGEVKDA